MRFLDVGLTRRAKRFAVALALCALMPVGGIAQFSEAEADTLSDVQQRGILRCGIVDAGEGVSYLDSNGRWQGFFPDFCRFIAAATLGNAKAVEFVQVSYVTRFEALESDGFDVLMGNTTWTVSRDTARHIAFTHPLYFDGQGFLAHEQTGWTSLSDMPPGESFTACASEGTTTIENLRDIIEARNLPITVLSFQSIDSVTDSFLSHDCDLLTSDRLLLVALRLQHGDAANPFTLLSDVISKEPLGPAVREDDPRWFDIVQWSLFASLIAEEYGITSTNVPEFLDSTKSEIRRLLGLDPGIGDALGLSNDWARTAIEQVGSYGEIFDRTLGEKSNLKIDRGLNALWRDGGLMYAPPLR